MTARTLAMPARLAAALLATGAIFAAAAGTAGAATIYSNIASPLPGSVPSLGYEATSTSEFGGQVSLAAGATKATSVTVGMNTWACQFGGAEDGTCGTERGAKFEEPVKLSIYKVGPENSVGPLIFTTHNTFNMPYRPSANNIKCAEGASKGGWYDTAEKACHHGKLFKIKFNVGKVPLPHTVIISVAYNTTDYGYEPTHVPGPYDSLNLALTGSATVGSQPLPEEAYANSTWSEMYAGLGTVGTFSLAGEWGGYQPEFEVKGS